MLETPPVKLLRAQNAQLLLGFLPIKNKLQHRNHRAIPPQAPGRFGGEKMLYATSAFWTSVQILILSAAACV